MSFAFPSLMVSCVWTIQIIVFDVNGLSCLFSTFLRGKKGIELVPSPEWVY